MIPEDSFEQDAGSVQVRNRLKARLGQAVEKNADSRIDRKVRTLHNEACEREFKIDEKLGGRKTAAETHLADAQLTPFTPIEATPADDDDLEPLDSVGRNNKMELKIDLLADFNSQEKPEDQE